MVIGWSSLEDLTYKICIMSDNGGGCTISSDAADDERMQAIRTTSGLPPRRVTTAISMFGDVRNIDYDEDDDAIHLVGDRWLEPKIQQFPRR